MSSKVLFSYHGGHSGEFCDHASPCSLEDLVKSYIEKGFTNLGLSEHQPRESGFLYPEEKAKKRTSEFLFSRFEAYFKEARRLQKKYENQISILVGFETEVCDKSAFSLINDLRRQYSADYIVGSLHHVNGIAIDFSREEYERAIDSAGSLENLFCAYYDAQYQLISECKPEVIGHFDLIRIFAPQDFVASAKIEDLIKRNILAANSYGAVFEVNSRAFKKGFLQPYPERSILNTLAELGAEITLGDDSHGPKDVALFYEEALEIVRQFYSDLLVLKKDSKGLLSKVKVSIDDVLK